MLGRISLRPLAPTSTRSCIEHISHACGCADVRNFAHSHFRTHFQKIYGKKNLQQPHHARCTHFARVRVCGRAKFRTFALPHTFPKIFWQKKTPAATQCTLHTLRTRAGVRTCEISHIHTSAHISKKFLAKKTSSSHTMHVAHTSHVCGCADVRNFAHSHFRTHFQKIFGKKNLRQPHNVRCTHFARVRVCGRAKFRTFALPHTFTKNFWQ